MIYTYNIPNGFKTFSLATRAATSPPFCRAIAPIIAYNEVVRTTSIPDDSSFWTWIILAMPNYQRQELPTFLGVHLIISRIPICVAKGPSRSLDKISLMGTSVKLGSPSSAGCTKFNRSSEGSASDWVWFAVGDCSNAMFVCRFKIRRPDTISTTPLQVLFKHTKERQAVIESSPPLIKALVCNCQPFHLLRKHLVSSTTQHLDIETIQPYRITVALPLLLRILYPPSVWSLHFLWSIRPPRPLLAFHLIVCISL